MKVPSTEDRLRILQEEKLVRLQEAKERKLCLPHLYGWPFYKWAKKFFDSQSELTILCAANQISKSSTQIRKAIHWATESELWPKLWKTKPRQFWYLYPSKEVATAEFEKKWIPEFMPRDNPEEDPDTGCVDPKYGWTVKYRHGSVHEIKFRSGVSIFFKAYSQDVQKLQTGTVHAIFTDEELPFNLFDELMFRVAAVDGYFGMVFTATIGQEEWFRAMERIGREDEMFKEANKIQVSMYDCLEYVDGSTTPWTESKIQRVKNKCGTEAEIQRRVYGRFVMSEGLLYPSFTRDRNVKSVQKFLKKIYPNRLSFEGLPLIPAAWHVYSGTDIGSGGKTGHPAAISFIAVRPDYKYGVVFRGWRGNKGETTTSSDILDKYRIIRGNIKVIRQSYDWEAKDFFTYASRVGETFVKADKGRDLGCDLLNVLFKNQMLDILDIEELHGLANEFTSLTKKVDKRNAKDDFIDSCRYAATGIPWDYTAISDEFIEVNVPKKEKEYDEIEDRRKNFFGGQAALDEISAEIDEYNELYG